MNKYLILCMMCLGLSSTGQTTLQDVLSNGTTFSVGYGVSSDYVQKNSDGTFEVSGDSLTAIKLLFLELERVVLEREELSLSLNKSVVWSNTVSDYFKQSKKWKEYLKSIEKHGYLRSKTKKQLKHK